MRRYVKRYFGAVWLSAYWPSDADWCLNRWCRENFYLIVIIIYCSIFHWCFSSQLSVMTMDFCMRWAVNKSFKLVGCLGQHTSARFLLPFLRQPRILDWCRRSKIPGSLPWIWLSSWSRPSFWCCNHLLKSSYRVAIPGTGCLCACCQGPLNHAWSSHLVCWYLSF